MRKLKMTVLRGSGEVEAFGSLFTLGLALVGGLWLFGFNFGIENDGFAKYDDCRQVIMLKSDDWQRYFHKFTCTSRKTEKGSVMSGQCVSIETSSSVFSKGSDCLKAYVYEKEQTAGCNDSKYPYLGYDDMCHAEPQ